MRDTPFLCSVFEFTLILFGRSNMRLHLSSALGLWITRSFPRFCISFFNSTMTATLINVEKSKRTRTNVKQSKFGCFTCKYDLNLPAPLIHIALTNDLELDALSVMRQNLHVSDVGLQSASAKVIPKGPILIHRLRLHQRHQLYPCRPRLHRQ